MSRSDEVLQGFLDGRVVERDLPVEEAVSGAVVEDDDRQRFLLVDVQGRLVGVQVRDFRPGDTVWRRVSGVVLPPRFLEVVTIGDGAVVSRVDVSRKGDRAVEKVLSGMLRNMDVDRYFVRDTADAEEESGPRAEEEELVRHLREVEVQRDRALALAEEAIEEVLVTVGRPREALRARLAEIRGEGGGA